MANLVPLKLWVNCSRRRESSHENPSCHGREMINRPPCLLFHRKRQPYLKTQDDFTKPCHIGIIWIANMTKGRKSKRLGLAGTLTPKKKASSQKKRPIPEQDYHHPIPKKAPAKRLPTGLPIATSRPVKMAKKSIINWSALPRVDSSMTIAQLCHELIERNPTITCLSTKSKTWLLSELGEGSICMTSPSVHGVIDFSQVPRVSGIMTISQLKHEILSRSPRRTGLSSRTKDDLLKIAGVGSLWTTGYNVQV